MSETMQFTILTGGTVVIFLLLNGAALINRWHRTYGTGSARFVTAAALTNLARKIHSVVAPGVEILMPAGYGTYPLSLSNGRRQQYEAQLKQWLDAGAYLTVIISTPNKPAAAYWQSLLDRMSPRLTVFLLDRNRATTEEAIEIATFDQFHPVLVSKGDRPLGMWLEAIHEPDTNIAYNIEYVAADDIVDAQRDRFLRLLGVLRRLTDESRQPRHLTRLYRHEQASASAGTSIAAHAAYEAA